jgi:hypothetical protein
MRCEKFLTVVRFSKFKVFTFPSLRAGFNRLIPHPPTQWNYPMQVINKENAIFFDVDDTLVLWDAQYTEPDPTRLVEIVDPYDNKTVFLAPHHPHIKLLKNHHTRGTYIVVWSQGGFAWAEAVVKALGLEDHVDLIMSKPRAYVDDLPADAWMKERIYISPNSKWGVGFTNE